MPYLLLLALAVACYHLGFARGEWREERRASESSDEEPAGNFLTDAQARRLKLQDRHVSDGIYVQTANVAIWLPGRESAQLLSGIAELIELVALDLARGKEEL